MKPEAVLHRERRQSRQGVDGAGVNGSRGADDEKRAQSRGKIVRDRRLKQIRPERPRGIGWNGAQIG